MNSNERDLDCTNAKRGIWLVKVPKYLSSRWQKAPPKTEVGRLKIKGAVGKPDIKFTLNDEIVNMKDPTEKTGIPKEHQFAISKISNQTLAVFSSLKNDNSCGSEVQTGSGLFMEGHVVRKGECRPMGDDQYMKLKMHTIIQASQPERQVKHLKKIVQTYKPISDHKSNIEFELKKKAEGKKSREDKDKVMDLLFSAFEKHQYYNLKDLEKITHQPVPYLKEILKEICNYNAKNPHKNMWELKPEYRHYKDSKIGSSP